MLLASRSQEHDSDGVCLLRIPTAPVPWYTGRKRRLIRHRFPAFGVALGDATGCQTIADVDGAGTLVPGQGIYIYIYIYYHANLSQGIDLGAD